MSKKERYGLGWHGIATHVHLPRPIDEVFDFFADAANLERITPPELKFRILTTHPIEICEGTLIDYRLQLFGVPFKWRTEIIGWQPPHRFVDQQLRGPYRVWHHTHTFTPDENKGTVMRDVVRYRLPLFPFGEAAFPLVHHQVQHIFAYRQKEILKIFSD